MKGVDQFDQNLSYYGYPHRFLKWWKNCFAYLTEIATYNSFIVYQNSRLEKISYLEYRLKLAFQLTHIGKRMKICRISEENMAEKSIDHHPQDHYLVTLENKLTKKCAYCYSKGKKSSCRTICQLCKKGLHEDCFDLFHLNQPKITSFFR